MVDTLIRGRWERLEALGPGGTAWLAADHAAGGSLVVLKSVAAGDGPRLEDELGRQIGLAHPNLGVAAGLIRDPAAGEAHLITPWYPGGDLRAWVVTNPSVRERVRTIAGVARGLRFLHERGLVHRDLKLENIVRDDLGEPRIIDFGLAALATEGARDISGTALTLAPEMLAGAPATEAGDRYALGVIAWELLTGRPPIEGTPNEILRQRAEGASVPEFEPLERLPGLDALGALVVGLLNGAPDKRPTLLAVLQATATVLGDAAESTASLLARVTPSGFHGRQELQRSTTALLATLALGRAPLPPVLWITGPEGSGRTAAIEAIRQHAFAAGLDVPDSHAPVEPARLAAWLGLRSEVAADEMAAELTAPSREAACLIALDGAPAPELRRLLALAFRLQTGLSRIRVGLVVAVRSVEFDSPAFVAFREEIERFSQSETIELGPLDVRAIRSLAGGLTPGAAAPDSFVADLLARTGGQPTLVHALLEGLLEEGHVRTVGPGALPDRLPESVTVPKTVADAARRSVEALSPGARRVLLALTLLGDRIDEKRFGRLTGLERSTAEAIRAGLVGRLRASPASTELTLLGETAREAAQSLHGRQETEVLASSLVDGLLEEKPVDPLRLGRLDAVLGRFESAAGNAELAGRIEDAARWYALAFRSTPSAPLARSLARVLATLGDFAGARAALSGLGDARALLDMVALELDAGRPREALDAIEAMAAPSDPLAERRTRALAARAALLLGDPSDALARLGDAAALDPGAVFETWTLHARLTHCLAIFYLGRYDEALEAAMALVALVGPNTNQFRESPMLLNAVGIIHQRRGEMERANGWYARSLDGARQQGNLPRVGVALMNLGTLAQEAGRLSESLRRYEEAAGIARRTGDDTALLKALLNETNVLVQLGALDEADARLGPGRHLAERRGSEFFVAYYRLIASDAAFRRGDTASALVGVHTSLDAFERLGSANEAAECALLEARATLEARLSGQIRARLDALGLAADRIGSARLRLWRGLLEAEWLTQQGDPAGALSRLEETERAAPEETGPEERWRLDFALTRAFAVGGRGSDARLRGRETRRQLDRIADPLEEPHRRLFERLREVAGARERLAFIDLAPLQDGGDGGLLRQILDLNARLATETDPDRMLRTILDIAIGTTGAERGFVLTPVPGQDTDAGSEFAVRAARNFERETLKRSSTRYSASVAEEVLATGRPLLTVDAMADDRLRLNQSIHALKLRSVLCVPMRRRGVPVGVVYVDNRFQRGAFTTAQLGFMEAFADQASIALESAETVRRESDARAAAEEASRRLGVAHAEVARLNQELVAEVERRGQALEATQRELESERRTHWHHDGIVGDSPAMRRVFAIVDRLAPTTVSVLVTGESGTGKELIARALHERSPRAKAPFVSINCAALPENLLESEFFGVVRGAFTGADRDRPGLFEQANLGTLFLDEVGEMSVALQAKLLRALETRTVRPVGGRHDVPVDVRIVSATNRDLAARVREGAFREDLLFRLRVVDVHIQPLRERLEDLPKLVEHIARRAEERLGLPARPLTPDALIALGHHAWPGNVRELEGVLTQAYLLAEGPVIRRADLRLTATGTAPTPSQIWDGDATLEAQTRAIVRATWEHFGRNQSLAAKALGIERATLRQKLGPVPEQRRGRPRKIAS